jgi:hypothetical protein
MGLYQRYDIDCIESDALGVVGFNYRNLSPLGEPLVRECRGLILEQGTWAVACKSMDAFFHLGDPLCQETLAAFDWSTALATEKRDGAILCLYHYKGAWRIASRVSPDGQWKAFSVNGATHDLTWEGLVKLTLADMGTPWEEFTARLDADIFYSFELCAPEVRVGVVYPERTLTLIAAVRRSDLEEIDIYDLDFPSLKPRATPVRSIEEAQALVQTDENGIDIEGYVVRDGTFRRFKLIHPAYAAERQAALQSTDAEQIKALRVYMMSGGSPATSFTDAETGTNTDFSQQSFSVLSEREPNLLARIVRMTGATAVEYGRISDLDDGAFKTQAKRFFWPEGLTEMREEGKSVTDLVEAMPDADVLALLGRFEKFVATQV